MTSERNFFINNIKFNLSKKKLKLNSTVHFTEYRLLMIFHFCYSFSFLPELVSPSFSSLPNPSSLFFSSKRDVFVSCIQSLNRYDISSRFLWSTKYSCFSWPIQLLKLLFNFFVALILEDFHPGSNHFWWMIFFFFLRVRWQVAILQFSLIRKLFINSHQLLHLARFS